MHFARATQLHNVRANNVQHIYALEPAVRINLLQHYADTLTQSRSCLARVVKESHLKSPHIDESPYLL